MRRALPFDFAETRCTLFTVGRFRGLSYLTSAHLNLDYNSAKADGPTLVADTALIIVRNLKDGRRTGFEGSTLPLDTETTLPLDRTPNLLGTLLFLGFLSSTRNGRPGGRTLLSLSSLPSHVKVILSFPL